MDKRTWTRGVVALATLGVLVAALIASPVGAALTRKKVKATATKVVNSLTPGIVNQLAPGIANQVAGPLAGRFAFARDDGFTLVGTSGTLLATAIIAPTNGHLAINAGTDSNGVAAEQFTCFLDVDGTDLPSTSRLVEFGSGNTQEDCTTEGAVAVTAGTHTVRFEAADVDGGTTLDESVLWVIFVPFDGGGSLPTGPSLG